MDFLKLREQFPVTENVVYLNHAAVAPISKKVKEALDLFLDDYLAQGYLAGAKWHALTQKARSNCATLIGAISPEEIAFTPSTSHGLSLVAAGLDWKKGDEVLIPDCEFPANIYPWLHLEKKGVQVKLIPSKQGSIDFDSIQKCTTPKTKLLSISSVQYGSGWQAPLEQLGKWCKENKILFCVDAIQSLGVLPMDVEKFQIDFLAADGHKWLLAPEGTALFYCRKKVLDQIQPQIIGWKTVKNPLDFDHIHYQIRPEAQKFEPGSENALGIHAFNASVEWLLEIGIEKIQEQVFALTHHLVEFIQSNWQEAKIMSSLNQSERSGIVAIASSTQPEKIVSELLKKKIYLSSRRGWLRFSPHFYNTSQELEFAVTEAIKVS